MTEYNPIYSNISHDKEKKKLAASKNIWNT